MSDEKTLFLSFSWHIFIFIFNNDSERRARRLLKDQSGTIFVNSIYFSEELRDHFGAYGDIESINVKTDPNTGRSRGFAFIVFAKAESLDKVKLRFFFLFFFYHNISFHRWILLIQVLLIWWNLSTSSATECAWRRSTSDEYEQTYTIFIYTYTYTQWYIFYNLELVFFIDYFWWSRY